MADSRHLKSRDMHIMIKPLKVKYGWKITSMFRDSKHIGIETSTIRRCFYSFLSKQLIYFLLGNEKISCSCLNIELPEITE